MAFPDDDHVPEAVCDADGRVLAVAHVAPDISDEARAALAEVVAAAIRWHGSRPPEVLAEQERRQAASRQRIRARNARLRGEEVNRLPANGGAPVAVTGSGPVLLFAIRTLSHGGA